MGQYRAMMLETSVNVDSDEEEQQESAPTLQESALRNGAKDNGTQHAQSSRKLHQLYVEDARSNSGESVL